MCGRKREVHLLSVHPWDKTGHTSYFFSFSLGINKICNFSITCVYALGRESCPPMSADVAVFMIKH